MAVRTVFACDRCNAEPADHFAIDLGGGRKALDLCEPCQKETGLTELSRVVEEFGVISASNQTPPAAKRPGPKLPANHSEPWPCPKCGKDSGTRSMVMSHLVAIHGYDRVKASAMIPPRGEPVTCEVCGYLAQVGTGYSAHVVTQHGQDAWDRIKTKAAS